jgi:methyltransferase (TIGR00027 family)
MLAAEAHEEERIIHDPFAHLVVDESALAQARADENLQNVLRLRTRYIDDAVTAFAAAHTGAQVLLLGAGYDARAYRLDVPATYYEVDFPETLEFKDSVFAAHAPIRARVVVPVDLAEREFVEPLVAAGYSLAAPTVVVWEGVSMYLASDVAEGVVEQVSGAIPTGSQLVAEYAEMSWFKGSQFERNTSAISKNLSDGGEQLRAGIRDMGATLDRCGFDVLDDSATEDLRPRYGLPERQRFYPARLCTARKR